MEEDRLLEEYSNLVAQRFALLNTKEAARYLETPEITAEEDRLKQAFALHNTKAKLLREEINPARDLDNKDWQNDPYWNSSNQ